jgi:hypothetical protein
LPFFVARYSTVYSTPPYDSCCSTNTRTGKAVDKVNLTLGIPPKYSTTVYIRWNNNSVLAPLQRSSAQKPDPNSLRAAANNSAAKVVCRTIIVLAVRCLNYPFNIVFCLMGIKKMDALIAEASLLVITNWGSCSASYI